MKLIYRCRKNGTCSMRKETRYCCRFCRMKRCIDLGMTTEETPGTSYSMHLDYSDFHSTLPDKVESPEVHEFYNVKRIYEDNVLFMNQFQDRLNSLLTLPPRSQKLPYILTLLQQAAAAYARHNEQWPKSSKEGLNLSGAIDFNNMMCEYYEEFEHIATFCMEIEPFTKLSLQQKWVVMKRFSMRFMSMDRAFVTTQLLGCNLDDRRVVTLGGLAANYEMSSYDMSGVTDMPEDDLQKMFIESEWKYDDLFVRPMKRIKPDHFEFLFLLLSSLWDVENKKIPNYARRIYKLSSLLTAMDRMDELRIQDSKMSETFNIFKIDLHLLHLTI